MQYITLSPSWQQLTGATATVFVAQTNVSAELYIGASPSPTDRGFLFTADVPQLLPGVQDLGGIVWARGSGELRYATDG